MISVKEKPRRLRRKLEIRSSKPETNPNGSGQIPKPCADRLRVLFEPFELVFVLNIVSDFDIRISDFPLYRAGYSPLISEPL
jgi:hypothetical protein